jgi:hypothetical protein
MASLRTVLALTLGAAAAALVPVAAATAASSAPLPGAGARDVLPTGDLPAQDVTDGVSDALPVSTATDTVSDTLPVSTVTDVLPTRAVTGALGDSVGPLKDLTLDPLANTPVDPLDNGLGTQIADFKPVSTHLATDPVTHGGTLATLPVVGTVAGLLPG